jgi:replicative DNA helicase
MPDGSTPLFGLSQRLPPSNVQAEQALLGAILANNKAYEFCGGLTAEHFADPIHARIFAACARRIERGHAVDAVTLKNAFEQTGILDDVGGTAYLTQLLTAMVSINSAAEYARAVKDASLRRNLITIGESLVSQAFGIDPDTDGAGAAAAALDAIDKAAADGGMVTSSSMASAVDAAVRHADAAFKGDATAAGIMSGVPSLDAMWRGMWPGALDIIGARSRAGKTAFALQIVRHVAGALETSGKGCVAVFSLEMPARDLGLVNLASRTGISADDLRSGNFAIGQMSYVLQVQKQLATLPVEIIDQPALPLGELIGAARSLVRRKGVRLVMIDHRDLIARDPAMRRATELEWLQHVTRTLKAAAKAMGLPILLLVQASRKAEDREDPRPRISDLMYSGEADADNILLLYRPEIHLGDVPPRKMNDTDESWHKRKELYYREKDSVAGKADVIFAKRRFGPIGTVRLMFDGPSTTFREPVDLPPETADLWQRDL